MTPAALGAALRRAGLTPRALEMAFGTSGIARLAPARSAAASRGARAARGLPATPATAALRVFVAREPVATSDVDRALGAAVVDAALAHGLLARDGDRYRARHAVAPIGPSLLAIGDAWPDDSSHHLIGCLPATRAGRWLDVGTGIAIAPLARPDRAASIVAADVDPDSLALARTAVALSDIRHVEVRAADLAGGTGDAFDLVTFNLPIPAEAGLTTDADGAFRRAPPGADLLARFVATIPAHLAPGASIVMHAWLGAPNAAIVDALPGEVTTVRYTPPGLPPFGVVRWRPGAPPARRVADRTLTPAAPHLAWSDLDDAAA
jgi:hypothetical protein